MTAALRLAFGTLTAIPVRPPGRVDPVTARRAMLLAPLTVLPLVPVWALAHLVTRHDAGLALLASLVVIAATALYSRGLHLDGLADTADGLAASHDRDRALAVMRTGDVGPNGAATLVLTLLIQAVALGSLLGSAAGTTLAVVALVASRHTLALGCWSRVPAARATGLGATMAGTVTTGALTAAAGLVAALAAGLAQVGGSRWYVGPVVVIAAMLGGALMLRTAVRRLGGMTGDVLGAGVEISLAGCLLVAALVTS
ncbi:MAG: adenosylcobinamide-GDP ribazoletransferase [Actinomycetota bacterium]|nr:adenosylcobinamide-GDP ribazoletransferase [Actinomycetota bacterium]